MLTKVLYYGNCNVVLKLVLKLFYSKIYELLYLKPPYRINTKYELCQSTSISNFRDFFFTTEKFLVLITSCSPSNTA